MGPGSRSPPIHRSAASAAPRPRSSRRRAPGRWRWRRRRSPPTRSAAPVLLSEEREVPALTSEALAGLAPQGIEDAEGVQVIQVGDVAVPPDLETLTIGARRRRRGGDRQAGRRRARSADRREGPRSHPRRQLRGSRAGDAGGRLGGALRATRSSSPPGTRCPSRPSTRSPSTRTRRSTCSAPRARSPPKAIKELEKDAASVTRISNEVDPVESSIEFARFVDGDFGWNINDPGHGFVIANAERPLDAAVAAPLSAGGKPGPLLVTTDSADRAGGPAGVLLRHPAGLRRRPVAGRLQPRLAGRRHRPRSRSPSRRRSTSSPSSPRSAAGPRDPSSGRSPAPPTRSRRARRRRSRTPPRPRTTGAGRARADRVPGVPMSVRRPR